MLETNRRRAITGLLSLPAAAAARPARAARISLKLASDLVDTHPGIIRWREAVKEIAAETNGDVSIRVFANGQLGSAQDMLNQIRSGAVDFYPAAAAGLSAAIPVVSISSMGFAFQSYDQVWAAMGGRLGALVREEIAKSGTVVALEAMWDNGFRQVTNSLRPVSHPDALRGMKIRVPVAPLYTSMFSALGAAPAALSIAELYTSLQSRLVDAQENPLPIIDLYKFDEVQKYCSITNHMWDGWWLLANARSWSRLPPDARIVVAKHLNAAALAMRSDIARLNDGVASRLAARGLVINPVPDVAPFRTMLSRTGFYETWRKTYGADAWAALEAASGPLG